MQKQLSFNAIMINLFLCVIFFIKRVLLNVEQTFEPTYLPFNITQFKIQ